MDSLGSETHTVHLLHCVYSNRVNEEMIETLFVSNSTRRMPKNGFKEANGAPCNQENKVLDAKKSQNIAIMLRALDATKEEVCKALLDGEMR